MQTELTYAPIIIPTLNRCEHLKRCIKSLVHNTGADKTPIFISVDYPPSKQYEKGYHEVVKYLHSTEDLKAFKHYEVFYQKSNLGGIGNSEFLKKIVREKYPTYIYSEDDNEFSVNFLEYINKGLARYELDDRVIAINGMKDADWFVNGHDNVVASKLFPAYGYGTWIKKERVYTYELSKVLLSKDHWKLHKVKNLYKRNKYLFALYITGIVCNDSGLFYSNQDVRMCDTTLAIYMYFTDKICIVPLKSKSRTWGYDGSGMTMPEMDINPETRWILDQQRDFDYADSGLQYDIRNDAIAESFLIDTFGKKLIKKALLEYSLLLLLGYNRTSFISIRKRIKWNK